MSEETEERFYYNDLAAPRPNVPLKPGAAAIVFDEQRRILIIKRTRGPYWCIPGGRMDIGESASDCCVRETWEETGLQTHVKRLIGLYTNPQSICSYPDGNVYQCYTALFECEVVGGALTGSDEGEHFHWLAPEELDDYHLLPSNVLGCRDAWADQEAAFIR